MKTTEKIEIAITNFVKGGDNIDVSGNCKTTIKINK
jgi:hypothetical protein